MPAAHAAPGRPRAAPTTCRSTRAARGRSSGATPAERPQPRRRRGGSGAPVDLPDRQGHLQHARHRRRRHRLHRLRRSHVLRHRAATARCAGSSSPARSSTPRRCSTTAAASTSAPATAISTRSTPRPATPVWTFTADPPAVNGAFINWFEGNVAIGADGTLYVPNDNFFTYALDRDTARCAGASRRRTRPGRCPPSTPRRAALFMGNNFQLLGTTSFAIDAAPAAPAWKARPTARSRRARCSTRDGRGRRRLRRLRARYDQATGAALLDLRRARPHLREPGRAARRHDRAAVGRRHRLRARSRDRRGALAVRHARRRSARRRRSTATATSTSAPATAGSSCSTPTARCAGRCSSSTTRATI